MEDLLVLFGYFRENVLYGRKVIDLFIVFVDGMVELFYSRFLKWVNGVSFGVWDRIFVVFVYLMCSSLWFFRKRRYMRRRFGFFIFWN